MVRNPHHWGFFWGGFTCQNVAAMVRFGAAVLRFCAAVLRMGAAVVRVGAGRAQQWAGPENEQRDSKRDFWPFFVAFWRF